MKKTLFFLVCSLLLLPGCSNDEGMGHNPTNSSTNKIRWYGTKLPEVAQTRGVADKSKLWNQNVGIAIKFINNPAEAGMINTIKQIASEWERYAGIKFNFVSNKAKADVRIAFDWQGNDQLTWSYTGTDAKTVTDQTQPTVVFGGLEYLSLEELRGDILRVFGQILGLEYEQRHQNWYFWKDESQLEVYWKNMFNGMNLNWSVIREYVFTPLSGENSIYPTQTTEIDELSIMAWPYYNVKQTSNIIANFVLSESDKAFIATLYPKSTENTLPTIQEAWVNAGYFYWTDETMTALRITELGAQQEYLPDVSDGERLRSAEYMFNEGSGKITYLKKAPHFITSEIINFSNMFYNCRSLTSLPLLDTSKGTDFLAMFYNCSSLTTIPLLDTSKGTDFRSMFYNCSSLTKKPVLDLSKATDTGSMFSGTPFE